MALFDAIQHIFLPPKLPPGRLSEPETNTLILDTISSALEDFAPLVGDDQRGTVLSAARMIINHKKITDPYRNVDQAGLRKLLRSFTSESSAILIHVREQNAAIIIRPALLKQSVVFEAFELTPPSEEIVTTVGRLRRSFPQISVSISWETFISADFWSAMASTISKMSAERVSEMNQAEMVGESTAPHLVMRLLFPYLQANGKRFGDRRISKNTREEVCSGEAQGRPFKRSPVWLCIRVALHLELSAGKPSDDLYKKFLVFYMARLLKEAASEGLASDIIHVMNAKIARRLVKLDLTNNEAFMSTVALYTTAATRLLESRWSNIIDAQSRELELTPLNEDDVAKDTALSLPDLDSFLETNAGQQRHEGHRSFQPSSQVVLFSPDVFPDLAAIGRTTDEYRLHNLNEFEHWVCKYLDSWIDRFAEEETCTKIKRAIKNYHEMAKTSYAGHPEGLSVMILTVAQLWIACDKSAIKVIPLLAEYNHDVPLDAFQHLIFRLHAQMERLFHCERYLKQRTNNMNHRCRNVKSAIFNIGSKECFSTSFAAAYPPHSELLNKIESHVLQMKSKKLDEMHQLLYQHERLMNEYTTTACSEDLDPQDVDHLENCSRCQCKSEASSLIMDIFEDPLPRNRNLSLSLVFEMAIPPAFQAWRECSLYFLRDVLQLQPSHPSSDAVRCKLASYQGLTQFHDMDTRDQTISLASDSIPRATTHPQIAVVPGLDRTLACAESTMTWRFFDISTDVFISGFRATDAISKMCRFNLPERSVHLQSFLTRSRVHPEGPRPNSVITSQDLCPKHLSKKAETITFVLQLTEQTGAAFEDALREAHRLLADEEFASAALSKLRSCFSRVASNWQNFRAVWAFVLITTRILAQGPVGRQRSCLELLSEFRHATVRWLDHLREKASFATENAVRSEYLERSLEVALVCLSTFDVDGEHLEQILRDSDSAAVYYECLIHAHERRSESRGGDVILQTLTFRSKRLTRRALPALMGSLAESQSLNSAMARVWTADFPPQQRWESAAQCWVSTVDDMFEDSVHLNLLTGELLINGLSPSRLPMAYEVNSSFKTLFGGTRPEVIVSRRTGMRYQTRNRIHGNQVYLNLKQSSSSNGMANLKLQTEANGSIFDLIPPHVFHESLPRSFSSDYVHFYSHEDRTVEFRPKSNPWEAQETNLRLTKSNSFWHLHGGGLQLIGCSSPTAKEAVALFNVLEEPDGIHVFYRPHKSEIQVHIQRFSLDFSMQIGSSHWKCRQYRGMMVDTNQKAGTLVGLRNFLVLRKEGESPSLLPSRMVLIPEGSTYKKESFPGHISIQVDFATVKRLQAYQMDNHLGRLVGNGSLESKILLAHLHALTSFCLPDPLTDMTGTEQALRILQGGEVASFDSLTVDNVDTLCKIAGLTTKRHFPKSKNKENKVEIIAGWDRLLSPLSQHPGFLTVVTSIFEQATETRFLHSDVSTKIPELNFGDGGLLSRFAARASTFYNCNFSSMRLSFLNDGEYDYRELEGLEVRSNNVLTVCSILANPGKGLLTHLPRSNKNDHLLKKCFGHCPVIGPPSTLSRSDSSIRFDTRWLENPRGIFPSLWLLYHHAFNKRSFREELNRHHVMLWFATIAFAQHSSPPLTRALLGLVSSSEVREVDIPEGSRFDLEQGTSPKRLIMRRELKKALKDFETMDNEHNLLRDATNLKDCKDTFRRNCDNAIEELMKQVVKQWSPDRRTPPSCPGDFRPYMKFFNRQKATTTLQTIFQACHENITYHKYLKEIEDRLTRLETGNRADDLEFQSPRQVLRAPRNVERFVTINKALESTTAATINASEGEIMPALEEISSLHRALIGSQPDNPEVDNTRLFGLLESVGERAVKRSEHSYAESLGTSFEYLQSQQLQNHKLATGGEDLQKLLDRHLSTCKRLFDTVWNNLQRVAGHQPQSSGQLSSMAIVASTHHWPRITISTALEQLNIHNRELLSPQARDFIVLLGISLRGLQQAERMVRLANDESALVQEIRNHQSLREFEDLDALLLEIDRGIRIRPEQKEVAANMKNPPGGKNASFQLHMGGGKSSVILPMVAAAVADGSRLARVIVAKPQSRQMLETLAPTVGGLLGRRLYHLPFARAIKLEKDEALAIESICKACREDCGILVVQPEHILSLQLMAILKHTSGNPEDEAVGSILGRTLDFLDKHGRDIIDESDENFSPKFELIYTIGNQRPVEFAPDRWGICQQVLALVSKFAKEVERELPNSIEVDDMHRGRFPRIRFLEEKASLVLCRRIAENISQQGILGLRIGHQPEATRKEFCQYLTCKTVEESVVKSVEEKFWTEATKNGLLLLRGLMAGGLLWFVFGRKRWTVDFGLDPDRKPSTRLAVPYRAKDRPSPSDFCNPDIQILLTCLCYYYGGVPDDDLLLSLDQLSKSEAIAGDEYSQWVSDCPSLPESFRVFEGLNLRDKHQCVREVFPMLRYSKSAADYFLSHIVFPKEMRSFPKRLCASGWDIGRQKANPTTAFSGTIDSRHLLPLGMEQVDLDSQVHTNALILKNLLSDQNTVLRTGLAGGKELLKELAKLEPTPRVILDVGAQFLEMTNQQVAEEWLQLMDDSTEAAVFCSAGDELIVVEREDGRVEPLQTSPFRKQLDRCLIYMDQSHTRGMDLVLPTSHRAAVTLGAKLTKDRLTQACMRMRKLGVGQTVVFCLPKEVEMAIRKSIGPYEPVSVLHILDWAIAETWADIRLSMAMWASQGRRFERHKILWQQGQYNGRLCLDQNLAEAFLEDEMQSLESQYRPGYISPPSIANLPSNSGDLERIVERCKGFGSDDAGSSVEEEQERQLQPEIEREPETEHAETVQPAPHRTSNPIKQFIESGQVPKTGVIPAFESLESTSARKHLDGLKFPQGLLVSLDFAYTLKDDRPRQAGTDRYQRNVEWVLTSHNAEANLTTVIVISPYEAEKQFDLIKASKYVTLHIYAPRQSRSHEAIDNLRLYRVTGGSTRVPLPPKLVIQLNLFAGQLYFSNYEEYIDTADYLCLHWGSDMDVGTGVDGFIPPEGRRRVHAYRHNFETSPVQFLKVLMTNIRYYGRCIDKTHVGKMLNGLVLQEEDFSPRPKRGREAEAG
ncbi:hypothetical protein CP533_4222 [Ophiocordyceps camponoti-saundersi (nom. inval.)]|nr:hypothetical protein CP533_4222 [Ophiocordyceps camponoti-saundersi (nom. inval.)]